MSRPKLDLTLLAVVFACFAAWVGMWAELVLSVRDDQPNRLIMAIVYGVVAMAMWVVFRWLISDKGDA